MYTCHCSMNVHCQLKSYNCTHCVKCRKQTAECWFLLCFLASKQQCMTNVSNTCPQGMTYNVASSTRVYSFTFPHSHMPGTIEIHMRFHCVHATTVIEWVIPECNVHSGLKIIKWPYVLMYFSVCTCLLPFLMLFMANSSLSIIIRYIPPVLCHPIALPLSLIGNPHPHLHQYA